MIRNSVAYIIIFSFLLTVAGCTTTEHYSDTPEKIFSGKSEIDLKGDYILDRISLRGRKTIGLQNFVVKYMDRQKEKYLLYYNPKLKVIDYELMQETNSKALLYKKPVADTLNFTAIDSMYFTGSKTDESYTILGCVIGIPLVLFFGGWFIANSMKEHK